MDSIPQSAIVTAGGATTPPSSIFHPPSSQRIDAIQAAVERMPQAKTFAQTGSTLKIMMS
jgi:hypothetical protein